MKSIIKHALMTALAIAGCAALAPTASAAPLIDETFESYTLGDSNGQGGW
ncbi:MAG: PBP1b-binding outer membrane lipoprotein LpoB, partial [Verrucomicrobiales bacterium]